MQVFTYAEFIATIAVIVSLADLIRKCIKDYRQNKASSRKSTKK